MFFCYFLGLYKINMTETYEIEFEECLVNGITSYKCSICSESFKNKEVAADHHYSNHASKTTKSDSIAKNFFIKEIMTKPCKMEFEKCLVNGITSYKCLICTEIFNNKQLLADHHYSTHVSKTTKNDSIAKNSVIKDIMAPTLYRGVLVFVNSETLNLFLKKM